MLAAELYSAQFNAHNENGSVARGANGAAQRRCVQQRGTQGRCSEENTLAIKTVCSPLCFAVERQYMEHIDVERATCTSLCRFLRRSFTFCSTWEDCLCVRGHPRSNVEEGLHACALSSLRSLACRSIPVPINEAQEQLQIMQLLRSSSSPLLLQLLPHNTTSVLPSWYST